MTVTTTAQTLYVKKIHKRHRRILFGRLLLFLCFFVLWETASRFGWINDFIFSSPSKIASCFLERWNDGTIVHHIVITLMETILSFLFVIFLSLLTSTLLWFSKTASELLEPMFIVLNALPKSALAPLLIVWLGTDMKTIIITGMSVAVFGSVLNLYSGFMETSPDKIKLIYTLGGKKTDALFKVVLPQSIPLIISTMKVNIGLCLVGVVIGEFLASKAGLGYLIIYGSQVFQLDLVLMSILLLCIIAMLLYELLHMFEKRFRV